LGSTNILIFILLFTDDFLDLLLSVFSEHFLEARNVLGDIDNINDELGKSTLELFELRLMFNLPHGFGRIQDSLNLNDWYNFLVTLDMLLNIKQ